MKRLCLLLIVLCLASSALGAAAVAYGRAQSLPADVQMLSFDPCEDAICFKGVVPGRTGAQRAAMLLSAATGTTIGALPILVSLTDKVWASVSTAPNPALPVTLHHPDDRTLLYHVNEEPIIVGPIAVSSRNGALPLSAGWLLARYGPPCRIIASPNGYDFTLFYSTLMVRLRASDDGDQRLSPFIPTLSLVLEARHDLCERGLPWRGFTATERYIQSIK